MPQTKSVAKALRASQKKRVINLRTKRKYKSAVKVVRDSLTKKNPTAAQKDLSEAYKQLDLAAKKKVIHKNKASRLKSRLTKAVNKTAKSSKPSKKSKTSKEKDQK